jgi:hypothetical protein
VSPSKDAILQQNVEAELQAERDTDKKSILSEE